MSINQPNFPVSKQFFDQQWHMYEQIVDNNYMAHREIGENLERYICSEINQSFSLLDLGCGDARSIPSIFSSTKLKSYSGFDISSNVLAKAKENLSVKPHEYVPEFVREQAL